MDARSTVAVFGATGTQGSGVIDCLSYHTDRYNIRAITRDATSKSAVILRNRYPKIELTQADLMDKESLKLAVKGAKIAFGITMPSLENITKMLDENVVQDEVLQGKNLVDAVKEEGCQLLIWSSTLSWSEVSGGKYSIPGPESKSIVAKYIKSVGVPHIIINTAWFTENLWKMRFLRPSSDSAPGRWEINIPITEPDRPIRMIWARRAIGNAVFTLIEHREEFKGQTVGLITGVTTFEEFARILSKASGVTVTYKKVGVESMGPMAPIMAQVHNYLNDFGGVNGNTELNPRLLELGHQPGTLEEFAATDFKDFVENSAGMSNT